MYEYKCRIVRVIDGDTVDVDIDLGFGIWIKNERIRLKDIDAPEVRTKDRLEKKCGYAAKTFLKDALGKISILRTTKQEKGKYGRVLGEFIVYDRETDSWISANKMLAREHLAVEYHGQSKESIEEEHLKNRQILQERGII